jgi:hypothetical protein
MQWIHGARTDTCRAYATPWGNENAPLVRWLVDRFVELAWWLAESDRVQPTSLKCDCNGTLAWSDGLRSFMAQLVGSSALLVFAALSAKIREPQRRMKLVYRFDHFASSYHRGVDFSFKF